MRRFVWVICLLGLAAGSVRAEQVGEATVRADLERYVRARVDNGSASIEIPRLTVFAIDRSRYPGALHTELSSRSREPFRGRVPITVALYAGSHLVTRNVISVYVRVTERIVVPKRNLRRGEVLDTDDLTYVERDAARLPADTIRLIDDAVGLRMKRSVRKGRELRLSQIEGVPLLERGDRVLLVLESGALKIQTVGRTKEDGAVGDWIRVVNLESKRELSGRVGRDGRVHVAF